MKKSYFLMGLTLMLCMMVFLFILMNLPLLQPYDESVSLFFSSLRSPLVTVIMRVISSLASPYFLIGGSILLAWIVRQRKLWVPIFLNLTFSVILNLGLKELYARPRPAVVTQIIAERGFSFPSGHSMGAAAFYGFVIYVIYLSGLKPNIKRWLTGLTSAIVLFIGISRIYLGVHYLSDVVAGFLVSVVYLIIFISFVHSYFNYDISLSDKLKRFAHPDSLLQSFAHAIDGIIHGLKAERNMVIHFAAMALVTTLAMVLRCTVIEWCILIILFALVIGSELINTAIEAAVDLSSPDYHPLAKLAKDTAAGAVLVSSLAAAIIGVIIFGPKLWTLLMVAVR